MGNYIKLIILFFLLTTSARAEYLCSRANTTDVVDPSCTTTFNNGWTNVSWGPAGGKVSAGDTLFVCGTFNFITPDMIIGNSGATANSRTVIDGNCSGNPGIVTLANTGTNVVVNYPYFDINNISFTSSAGTGTGIIYYNGSDGSLHFTGDTFSNGTYGIYLPTGSIAYSDIVVSDTTFQGQTGKGFVWNPTGTQTSSISTIKFIRDIFRNITTAGIDIHQSTTNTAAVVSDITIDNTKFYDMTGYSIWATSNTTNVASPWGKISVTNVTCGNVGSCISSGGNNATTWGDNNYTDNTIYNTTMASGPLDIFNSKYVTIARNQVNPLVSQSSTNTSGQIDNTGVLLDFGNQYVRIYDNNINRMLGEPTKINSGCAINILSSQHVWAYNNKGTGNKHSLYASYVGVMPFQDVNFFYNTFTNSVVNGILLRDTITPTIAQQFTFKNNSLSNSGTGTGFNAETSNAETVHSNNIFYNFSTTYTNQAVGIGESTANPVLDDNYRPLPTSPAINAGVCLPEVTDDYVGTHRPWGSGCTIGAYETKTGMTLSGLIVNGVDID
ncbi:exported hypothetical protein [Gammaproteobacteria bacterium]